MTAAINISSFMRLLISTLTPLSLTLPDSPVPVNAIPAFVTAGHEVYVAAPIRGRADRLRKAWQVRSVLPLQPVHGNRWLSLTLNIFRVTHWSKRWAPDLFLSLGAQSGLMAQGGRGVSGGRALSMNVLPMLQHQHDGRLAAFVERLVIQQCDRLVTFDREMARLLQDCYHARGGDLFVLNGDEPGTFVTLCERLLAEPPGFN